MNDIYDVVIVGGGLVGLAMAGALQHSALKIALVDTREPDLTATKAWDTRVYAISPGSQTFLAGLGGWQNLDVARVQPITRMEIAGDAGGMMTFDAFDAGVSELATIVEESALRRALRSALNRGASVDCYIPFTPTALEITPDLVRLQLDRGKCLSARLIIAADGTDSWVRRAANIDSTQYRYAADGLVANFRTERAHHGVARQWFHGDSVLAWLPLPENHISIVWATPRAAQLAGLEPHALARAVLTHGTETLGELQLVNKPALFPLSLTRVAMPIRDRVALIGDAAHSVHPLAGQGINLGFMDAAALAAQLTQSTARADCGHASLLRAYVRTRKPDVMAMQLATHGLQKLFAEPNPLLRVLRNRGFDISNRQAWLKQLFIRHAFGGPEFDPYGKRSSAV